MTDINKLIEEEKKLAIKDRWSYYKYSDDPTYAYREGYESGIEKGVEIVLHQNRWRKVSEEVPENQDIVLVKTDKGCFATAYHHGKESGFIIYGDEAYREFGEVTEWKPIE